MSAIVFAGSAQFTAIAILAQGGGAGAAVAAAALMNSRFLPMSAAVGPSFSGGPIQRGAEGPGGGRPFLGALVARRRQLRRGLLLGASAIAYVTWVSGTAVGALWGDALGDPRRRSGSMRSSRRSSSALLLNELRSRRARGVAALGAVIALSLVPFAPAGVPVLVASLAGARRAHAPRARGRARAPGGGGGAAVSTGATDDRRLRARHGRDQGGGTGGARRAASCRPGSRAW